MPIIISNSGWIAIPLILISIANLGLFLFTYSLIYITKESMRSLDWMSLEFFQYDSQVLIRKHHQTNSEINSSLKELYLDRWEIFTLPILRNASWISSFAASATLLGFLGTVLGIQESFTAMQELGKTTLDIFAGGVSRALSTTILGLCISIPSYLLNQFLRSELLQLSVLFQEKLLKMPEIHSQLNPNA